MQFTQDEKAALLKQFEPLLRGTVRRACACYNLNVHQVYNDLYQSAAEGFLRHLGGIKAAHHAGGCKKDLFRYVSEDVRRMHTVSIPRKDFAASRHEAVQLPLEAAEYIPDHASEELWVSDIVTYAFLDTLKEVERQAVLMRMYDDSTNQEIMPVIGAKYEMGVSRFFQKMGRAYNQYTQAGKEVAS